MNFSTYKYLTRVSAFVIAIMILFSVCASVSVSAEVISGKFDNNGTWTYDDETATLTYAGTGEIPYWYLRSYCKNVESVIFDADIRVITNRAFEEHKKLKSVKCGDTVEWIGDYAFSRCAALEEVTLSSTETIRNGAFLNCVALKEITLPNNLEYIGASAFAGCRALENIAFPSNLKTIATSAFGGCSALNSITLPNSITKIEERAFSECEELSSIVIPGSVKQIQQFTFEDCVNLSSVTIEEGVEFISSNAFFGCEKLKESTIKVPDSVTKIGERALSGFGDVILGRGITKIAHNTFANSCMKTIRIPDSVISICDTAFYHTDLETIYFEGTTEQWEAVEKGIKWYYNESKSQPDVICLGDASQEDSSNIDEVESKENFEPSSKHDDETSVLAPETVKSEAPTTSISEEPTGNGATWLIVIIVAIIAVATIVFVVKRK